MTFARHCLRTSVFGSLMLFLGLATTGFAADRGLVAMNNVENKALLVGVTYGLPGIDIDLDHVEKMAQNSNYQFDVTRLWEDEGTVDGTAKMLNKLSTDV